MPTRWSATASRDAIATGSRTVERGLCDKLRRLNQPTPAIVAQDAVRRLPRTALLLFCLAYVVPGFVGREPWKNADITAFGHMFELARGSVLLAGADAAGPAARIRCAAALLARRMGDPAGAGVDGPRLRRAHPVRAAAGADPGGHLVRRVLPGPQPAGAAGALRVRRRGQSDRLRPRHGRWRPAGADRLPRPGAAVARDHARAGAGGLHLAQLLCNGGAAHAGRLLPC